MTLLFIDSCGDVYNAAADVTKRWNSIGTTPTLITGALGGKAIRLTNLNHLQNTIAARATLVAGMRFRRTDYHTATVLIAFYDSTTLQCEVRLDANDRLVITRNGTVLATSTDTISLNVWYYLEFKVTIANSGGYAEARINGVNWVDFTGDTQTTANATADGVRFANTSNAGNVDVDDIYVLDSNGAANNDFLGDCRVEGLLPSGAGNYAQFTPSAGSNYENVDEDAQDGDSTYNESDTNGHMDTFAMGNLTSTSGSIYGLQWLAHARKTDGGARVMRRLIRQGGSDYEGSDVSLADTYAYYREMLEQDPDTSAAWTISGVNAVEAGYKRES